MAKTVAKSAVVKNPRSVKEAAGKVQKAQSKTMSKPLARVKASASSKTAGKKPAKAATAKAAAPKAKGGVAKRTARVQASPSRAGGRSPSVAKGKSSKASTPSTITPIKSKSAASKPTSPAITNHNMMRVETMSLAHQEVRIEKMSNEKKLQDLVQIYQKMSPPSPLLALAKAKLRSVKAKA